jgi:hypothetical protein
MQNEGKGFTQPGTQLLPSLSPGVGKNQIQAMGDQLNAETSEMKAGTTTKGNEIQKGIVDKGAANSINKATGAVDTAKKALQSELLKMNIPNNTEGLAQLIKDFQVMIVLEF